MLLCMKYIKAQTPSSAKAVNRDSETLPDLFKLGQIFAVLHPHGVLSPVPVSLFVVAQSDPASPDLLQSLVGSDVSQLHQHLLREQLVPRADNTSHRMLVS